jgi:phosphoglycerol transferase MdoB-like AlkP superfamily enzyme
MVKVLMKKLIANYIPVYYQFLFLSFALLMVTNTTFRLILFVQNTELAHNADLLDILYCLFNRGLMFDIYISLIILILPFLITSVLIFANKSSHLLLIACNLIVSLAGIILLAVSATDLGFFKYYNSRITNTVFNWTEEPGIMLSVMLSKSDNLPLFLLFLVLTCLYIYLQVRIFRTVKRKPARAFHPIHRIFIFLVMVTLMVYGIRGSLNPKNMPINYKDAFFSDDHFLNQLVFNPLFHFAYSYNDTRINFFKNEDEFINRALIHLDRTRSGTTNPFEMSVEGMDNIRPNIMIIFLESMSNAVVSRYHPELKTTPFLDSVAGQGIVFDHFYAAGVHTHNAIFSTLYGLPAVMKNTPMKTLATANQLFYGLPWILNEKTYFSTFYVTGSKKFDNLHTFLLFNGFDRIIGEGDYAPETMYDRWGATDKTMFERVLHDCDSLSQAKRPFFCSILTISSHEGYAVPISYRDRIINKKYPYAIYEYADMQLGDFMKSAERTGWFENTVFVFVGDHGQNFEPIYDMNLNYHEVPLIFYSPAHFDHLVYNGHGLQQDIYPTLFGLIDFNYINHGLGVDLLKQKREFGYFSADNKLGVIDDSLFLIYRGNNNISMYTYKGGSIHDVYTENPERASLMLEYGFAMVQSANYLIENKLTFVEPPMEARYEVNRFIAHAGGMIDDHTYTNSLEALNMSYDKGFRLFELDILRTSDNIFVAVHDWKTWKKMTGYQGELPPSHDVFMQYELFGNYLPLDMDRINSWFADHPDAILVTDKINEPREFSAVFVDKNRLMMELFTMDALRDGRQAGIRSAMASWKVLDSIGGDKVEALHQMGITDVTASRRIINDNLPLLIHLKNRGIRVYVFHVNDQDGIDESYVLFHDLDYVYGMYADAFDFQQRPE